jgi:hypothetical protein
MENICITGETNSYGMGVSDAFIANFNNTGNLIFQSKMGRIESDKGLDIILDDLGNIYITG